jgi:hypothetical protein
LVEVSSKSHFCQKILSPLAAYAAADGDSGAVRRCDHGAIPFLSCSAARMRPTLATQLLIQQFLVFMAAAEDPRWS